MDTGKETTMLLCGYFLGIFTGALGLAIVSLFISAFRDLIKSGNLIDTLGAHDSGAHDSEAENMIATLIKDEEGQQIQRRFEWEAHHHDNQHDN